jgi:hypothetical protein
VLARQLGQVAAGAGGQVSPGKERLKLTPFSIPFRNSTGTIYNCLRLSSLEEGRGSLAERLLDLDPTEFKDCLCSYAELLWRTKRKK